MMGVYISYSMSQVDVCLKFLNMLKCYSAIFLLLSVSVIFQIIFYNTKQYSIVALDDLLIVLLFITLTCISFAMYLIRYVYNTYVTYLTAGIVYTVMFNKKVTTLSGIGEFLNNVMSLICIVVIILLFHIHLIQPLN